MFPVNYRQNYSFLHESKMKLFQDTISLRVGCNCSFRNNWWRGTDTCGYDICQLCVKGNEQAMQDFFVFIHHIAKNYHQFAKRNSFEPWTTQIIGTSPHCFKRCCSSLSSQQGLKAQSADFDLCVKLLFLLYSLYVANWRHIVGKWVGEPIIVVGSGSSTNSLYWHRDGFPVDISPNLPSLEFWVLLRELGSVNDQGNK